MGTMARTRSLAQMAVQTQSLRHGAAAYRIEDQISCSLGVAPEGFCEQVQKGNIKAHRTEIERIEGKQIRLKNGATITADVLVCGTGFHQELPFLEESYRKLVMSSNGRFRLFRNIIHPLVPQIGFCRFQLQPVHHPHLRSSRELAGPLYGEYA